MNALQEIDERVFEQAKKVDMLRLMPGDSLKRHGRELSGPCPICQAGEDRFSIQPHQNTWVCRTCHPKYGTPISFVMMTRFAHISEGRERLIESLEYLLGGSIEFLNREVPKTPSVPKPKIEWKRPYWSFQAERIIAAFESHPNRVQMWQDYKPIPESTIVKERLGVGVLPMSYCRHERLILPVYENGILIGLRGRQLACKCGKPNKSGDLILDRWLNAKGTKKAIYGLYDIHPGKPLWIVENNADRLLLESTYAEQEWSAVSPLTGVATVWEPQWIQYVLTVAPSQVIIAFDNDEAGQPNREILRQFYIDNPDRKPGLGGQKLRKQFAEYGITARLWAWEKGSPKGADIGSFLMAQKTR